MPTGSPAARTTEWHRKRGLRIGRVEQRVNMPFAAQPVNKDLFGVFDYIALHGEDGILGLQVTGWSNHSRHRVKILENPELRENVKDWLLSGKGVTKAQIWSWGKRAQRDENNKFLKNKNGTRKAKTWQVRIEEITLEMIREQEEKEKMEDAKYE